MIAASSHDPLATTQKALPISLIATPRSDFLTCGPSEAVREVVARYPQYDHIPVTEDGQPDSTVIGLLDAHQFQTAPNTLKVVEAHTVLGEPHLIGSDAPIIDFILAAPDRGCRLLVSGDRISGLVTLSDLQAIPVRAALFTLITRLELAMVEWIKGLGEADSALWLHRLNQRKQGRLQRQIQIAKRGDSYIDDLSCTYFDDKADIVSGSGSFCWDQENFNSAMASTIKLRNALAHAQEFTLTRHHAHQMCETVHKILFWVDLLRA